MNPRIKEKTLWWQFKIIHTPGKKQLAADALSRRKSKLPAVLYRVSVTNKYDDAEEIIEDIKIRLVNASTVPDPRRGSGEGGCMRGTPSPPGPGPLLQGSVNTVLQSG